MSTADTYVRARIDSETKARASDALEAMGLSISDAIRLLMLRIADERRLPFEVKVPNAKTRKAMAEAGVQVTTVVGEGHAVHDGILRALESTGADLIVMGSHGRRGLEKLVLGSVTQRVLGVVHIPVLVVRG